MSPVSNSSYNTDFRLSSVKLALENDQPISQTAKDLGIKSSTLHTWVSNHKKGLYEKQFKSSNSEASEIAFLKKELRKVTLERDLLKKAAAYFAQGAQ